MLIVTVCVRISVESFNQIGPPVTDIHTYAMIVIAR